jgi:hypothetical protein
MDTSIAALERAGVELPAEHLDHVAGGVTALDIAVIVILILMFP